MARIPDEELSRVKREVDLVALVRAAGVELSPCGQDLRGKCPLHPDDTPSLVITPSKGLWHCFGCNEGGDVISWVQKTQGGLSFRHAVEILRAGNADLSTLSPGVHYSTVRHLPSPIAADADDGRLLADVANYYHECLKQEPEALAYLEHRGLRSSEMNDVFRMGFGNRTLGLRIPQKSRAAGAEVRSRMTALGILRETGHEHFGGCITYPITDESGTVVSLYGRKITQHLPPEAPRHMNLKGPKRGVWNVVALAASREVILCESIIDACSFWAAGYKNVIAALGVHGVTDDHWNAFKRHGTKRVLIAFDRDDAGDKAADELAPRLAEAGIDVARILFPRDTDANEYACHVRRETKEESAKDGAVCEALGEIVRSAQFVRKGRRTSVEAGAPVVPSAPESGPADGPPSPPSATEAPAPSAVAEPPASEPSEEAVEPLAGAAGPPSCEAVDSFPSTPAAEGAVEKAATGESSGGSVETAQAPPAREPAPDPSIAAALSPFAAVPLPSVPSEDVPMAPVFVVRGDEQEMRGGDRVYRVRGLWRNLSPDQMRVNIHVSRGSSPEASAKGDGTYHVDTFDLLSARARALYIREAAAELSVTPEAVKKDLGKLLLELELLQRRRIEKVLTPAPGGVEMSEAEKAEALALLRSPRLIDLIVGAFDQVGLVGERTNKLVGYLAAVSRKLSSPLAILIQSNSAAGKSALMDAILLFVPKEDVERFTALTAQALYYMGQMNLKHRILAIAEVAGADRAGYPIKMLQSEGRISIATTVKDPETGEMTTKRHELEGPVAIFLTTTEAEIDEELQNRALVLTVNEDREQTRAIHNAQRRAETLEGVLAAEEREAVIRLHRNAQRLLRPLRVVNPFAGELAFPDTKLRTRRDHVKYLALIRAITLLHQYQRPVRHETRHGRVLPYIEVTREDIELAKRLADEVLGHSLDELAPQTRRLLMLLEEMVSKRCAERKVDRQDYRFTRRELREYTEWSDFQVQKHLGRLVEMEHVLVHRGGRGQCFVYELLWDGQGRDGRRFVVGLVDARSRSSTTVTSSPPEGHFEPPCSPQMAPIERGYSTAGNGSG